MASLLRITYLPNLQICGGGPGGAVEGARWNSILSIASFSTPVLVSELHRLLAYLFPFYGIWQAVGSDQSDLPHFPSFLIQFQI
jgi:hypothetical protein